MNRSRGLSSYQRELGLAPTEFLSRFAEPRWLDLCCGEGRALWEAAAANPHLRIHGVDLAGHFRSGEAGSAVAFSKTPIRLLAPEETYHLITCVHGLHYVGDKMSTLLRLAGWLTPEGLFVGHFDPQSIKWTDGRSAGRSILAWLRQNGWSYDSRRRLLRGGRLAAVDCPFEFVGADPEAGPNFTGQAAVNAYYKPLA